MGRVWPDDHARVGACVRGGEEQKGFVRVRFEQKCVRKRTAASSIMPSHHINQGTPNLPFNNVKRAVAGGARNCEKSYTFSLLQALSVKLNSRPLSLPHVMTAHTQVWNVSPYRLFFKKRNLELWKKKLYFPYALNYAVWPPCGFIGLAIKMASFQALRSRSGGACWPSM